jgi:hypothetical protein
MNSQPADKPVDRFRFAATSLLIGPRPSPTHRGRSQSPGLRPQDQPLADTRTDLRKRPFSPPSTVVMTVSVLIDCISNVEQAADEDTCAHPPVRTPGASRHRVPHTNPLGGPR